MLVGIYGIGLLCFSIFIMSMIYKSGKEVFDTALAFNYRKNSIVGILFLILVPSSFILRSSNKLVSKVRL